MYAIKCNGVFVHSIIPHPLRGISLQLVDDDHIDYLFFDEFFHAVCMEHILQEYFCNKDFEVIYLG